MHEETDDTNPSGNPMILPAELTHQNLVVAIRRGMTSIGGFSDTTATQGCELRVGNWTCGQIVRADISGCNWE